MLTDKDYRDAVRHEHGHDGEIEVYEDAEVAYSASYIGEPGAWIQAWIWMSEQDAASWKDQEPPEHYGEPPITNAERLETGEIKSR